MGTHQRGPNELSLDLINFIFHWCEEDKLVGDSGVCEKKKKKKTRTERLFETPLDRLFFKEVAHSLVNVGNRDNHGSISAMISSGPTICLGYYHH